MRKQKVSTSGWELDWNVPENEQEYNSLAPKRIEPMREDAVNNTWYRSGAPKLRDGLCEYLERVTGVVRTNAGTDDKPDWEKEGAFIKRSIAEYLKAQNLDPASKANTETFRAQHQAQVQAILDGIAFDPSERESTGTGPSIAKTYTAWAAQAVTKDGGKHLAELLGVALNAPVTLTGDAAADTVTLAKAIALNEKKKREASENEYTG